MQSPCGHLRDCRFTSLRKKRPTVWVKLGQYLQYIPRRVCLLESTATSLAITYHTSDFPSTASPAEICTTGLITTGGVTGYILSRPRVYTPRGLEGQ